MKVKLETENLNLIPFSENHVEFYKNWMDDKQLRIDTSTEEIFTLLEWKNIQKNWENEDNMFSWIIFVKENNFQIGDINLIFNKEIINNEIELMVMIAEKNYRKKGYASEAIKKIIIYAKNCLKKDIIKVMINKENLPSINLFKKLEFKIIKEINNQIEMKLKL